MHARFEEIPIAFISHPVCACEMTIVHELGALRMLVGIEAENDRDGLAPIRAFGLGIQQPDVARQMFLVIGTDAIKLRRTVFEGGNGHRFTRALILIYQKLANRN